MRLLGSLRRSWGFELAELISGIDEAAGLLVSGGLVSLPTETVYGLGACAWDVAAVGRVFRVKGRPSFDPLIVHVADVDEARGVVLASAWGAVCQALAVAFWPGSLTLVVEKASWVDGVVTAGLGTVGVRVPDHAESRAVIRAVNARAPEGKGGVAMPSANKFGRTSPTTSKHVLEEFGGDEIGVLDGGACVGGIESTVVRVEEAVGGKPARVTVLRPGLVTLEQISEAIGGAVVVTIAGKGDRGASPGSTERHYAPGVPLVVVDCGAASGTLAIESTVRWALNLREDAAVGLLRLGDDPFLAARGLYEGMRKASSGAVAIAVPRRQTQHGGDELGSGSSGSGSRGGAWSAVWDRVERAAEVVVAVGDEHRVGDEETEEGSRG